VLERPAPPEPVEGDEPDAPAEPEPSKGRGAVARKPKATDARAAKRIKGRTIYVPDDLWERVIVQSHRRGKTYSEYVVGILERQVPDHRVIRAEPDAPDAA
jgi:hypothetical protein